MDDIIQQKLFKAYYNNFLKLILKFYYVNYYEYYFEIFQNINNILYGENEKLVLITNLFFYYLKLAKAIINDYSKIIFNNEVVINNKINQIIMDLTIIENLYNVLMI